MQAGFPPTTFQPEASGGTPPFGSDMNGILLLATQWIQWQNAGGPVAYDATFSAEIGGYPMGAALLAANGLGWWFSIADNNITDPDTGGAGWLFVSITQTSNGTPVGSVAGQQASATGEPSLCWDYLNSVFWVCTQTGTTATAKWAPLSILVPVKAVTGPTNNLVIGNLGMLIIRSNSGGGMTDALPSGITNGWWASIINNDGSANDVISVPVGAHLNGVLNGTLLLGPGQNVTLTADANGDYWLTAVPVPRVFSAQAVYVGTSQSLVPGVYDIDTSAGSITITLEAGGVLGDNYLFRDIYGSFAVNPCIINPGTNTIQGQSGTMQLDVAWVEAVFTLKSGNWSLV